MDQRLNGENPLSYFGVNALAPCDFFKVNRAPTVNDYKNFIIGAVWLDTSNSPPSATDLYQLVSVAQGVATWIQFGIGVSTLDTLTGNIGGPVDADPLKNINIVSVNPSLLVTGNPITNTLSIDSADGNPLLRSLSDDASTQVFPDIAGDIQLTGTGGITVLSTPLSNLLTIDGSGAGGIETFTEDAGTASPAAGNLNVLGGTLISTLGAGDTITIACEATGTYTTDAGAATPVANEINIVGAGTTTTSAVGNTITITSSGGAGDVSQFTADDAGIALPVLGNINVFGTVDKVTTSAATDTITLDLGSDIATEYVCDTGTAVPVGGILNIVGGSLITTSGATDTVTISATTPPYGITTYFTSTGTWTKNPSTQYVTIYLWCGGGGGGGGDVSGLVTGNKKGGGGGSGGAVYVMLNEPEATFGASETIVVGGGGGGGTSDGSPGGVSSVGSVIVPPAQSNYGRSHVSSQGGGSVPVTIIGKDVFYAAGGGYGGGSGACGVFSNSNTISQYRNASLAGTGGGGGGSYGEYITSPFTVYGKGGNSGNQKLPNGTVVVLGATGGGNTVGNTNVGRNGNDGYVYNNVMLGGTGGSGAGAQVYNNVFTVTGGDGGFPAAGGGGSSGASSGSSRGGSGGNGLVIIIET